MRGSETLLLPRDTLPNLHRSDYQQVLATTYATVVRVEADPEQATDEDWRVVALHAIATAYAGDPTRAVEIASTAYQRLLDKQGPHGEATMAAQRALAIAQLAAHDVHAALRNAEEVHALYVSTQGEHAAVTLDAAADLATCLHRSARCTDGTRLIQSTVDAYLADHGNDPTSIGMLARMGAMLRDCGQFDRAHQVLGQARHLARTVLPPGDGLVAAITALARAGADANHACTAGIDPSGFSPAGPLAAGEWLAAMREPGRPTDQPVVENVQPRTGDVERTSGEVEAGEPLARNVGSSVADAGPLTGDVGPPVEDGAALAEDLGPPADEVVAPVADEEPHPLVEPSIDDGEPRVDGFVWLPPSSNGASDQPGDHTLVLPVDRPSTSTSTSPATGRARPMPPAAHPLTPPVPMSPATPPLTPPDPMPPATRPLRLPEPMPPATRPLTPPDPRTVLVPERRPRPPAATGADRQGTMTTLSLLSRPAHGDRQLRDRLRRTLGGPRQVTVVNPKGGTGKTVASLMLALTFGQARGGFVLAWDNNETQGTLGMRAQRGHHQRTARDLLRDLPRFTHNGGGVAELAGYVREQEAAMFDVLASDESATAGAMLTAKAFRDLRDVMTRFYKLIIVDTGNNVRAENWRAAIDATDQLVLTVPARIDAAETAARMLDHLDRTDRRELVRRAIVAVAEAPERIGASRADLRFIETHFQARCRAVLRVPYDRHLDSGAPINYQALGSDTRQAWLRIAGAVMTGL